MSIITDIESLYSSLKDRLGAIPAEVDSFFTGQIATLKADADKVQAEAAHLQSLGWVVTPPADASPAPAADSAAPIAPVEGAPIA